SPLPASPPRRCSSFTAKSAAGSCCWRSTASPPPEPRPATRRESAAMRQECRYPRTGSISRPSLAAPVVPPLPGSPPMSLYDDITATIGNTPIVRLNRIAPPHVQLYVKVESFNPGGSVKDRLALAIILDAERRDLLRPGD